MSPTNDLVPMPKFYTYVAPISSMHSIFTDNSRAFYKKGSLAPGGVGTVRNVGRKANRT
jgi:hypothetical protein